MNGLNGYRIRIKAYKVDENIVWRRSTRMRLYIALAGKKSHQKYWNVNQQLNEKDLEVMYAKKSWCSLQCGKPGYGQGQFIG